MTSRDRVARHRQRRADSRVWQPRARWDEQSQQWLGGLVVTPWPHEGSEQRYNAGRCQCGGCLEAHRRYTNTNRMLRKVGPLTTDTIRLEDLQRMAVVRPPATPPPNTTPGDTDGRHRRPDPC